MTGATPDPAPEPLARWAADPGGARLFLTASAVAVGTAGVLILGASGAGKSGLALALLAHGAELVSDDGIWVERTATGASLCRPDTAPPLIEARGIGLLAAGPVRATAPLRLVVDLDRAEPHRLPPRRIVTFGTAELRLILGAQHPMLAPALLQLLRHGRAVP